MPSFIDLEGLQTFKEKLEENFSSSSNTAITKLYDELGNATDGAISQATVTKYLTAKRYGYRIRKDEADPDLRVEYLYDAAGMRPAHMVYDTDTATLGTDSDTSYFDYGSWADVWFIADNKPCMLKTDGSVDYYLDPNDYTKKEDDTNSNVAHTNYNGNAMAQFPLVWVYRYEDDDYYYEIVSDIQIDSNYKAYAHTDAGGNIKPYFYSAMFGASGNASKLRSLSGQALSQNLTTDQQLNGATANGSGWYIGTWAQRELIRTLLVLISKSTDSQAVFGNGFSGATSYGELPRTGSLKNKGQFFGYNTNNQQVKVFHIEEFWGTQKKRIAGLINYNGKIYVKMTPEDLGYQLNDVTGYTDTNIVLPSVTKRFITQARCGDFGMIPIFKRGGSSATYFCDTMYSNNTQLYYLLAGVGSDDITTSHGAFTFDVNTPPSTRSWVIGCTLSYV